MFFLCALLIGVIAGLRSMVAPFVVSWSLRLRGLHAPELGFMSSVITAGLFSVAAVGEIINDKRPTTPSRKTPVAFGARIVSGALCGAVIGSLEGTGLKVTTLGAALGAIGAVIGTLGGASARTTLATRFGKDLPAAVIEDVVAVVGGFAIAMLAPRLD